MIRLKSLPGTHLATPPKVVPEIIHSLPAVGAATAPVPKHVDFSSSTKARYERAQSELSSTPSKGPTPSPKSDAQSKPSPKSTLAYYPALPSDATSAIVTPQKRRQTVAPGDFTFRAGQHAITFGQSPNAPSSATSSARTSTIRHVSAEPQVRPATVLAPATGSKKRKFDFENTKAEDAAISDKENEADEEYERPAKRAKPSGPEPSPAKPATRLPTLGVKPKKTGKDGKDGKDKKPSTISMARLNALAQPKRRA